MRKKLENGYETERVLILPASSYRPHYWQTETVPVNHLDKFNFSVDRRLTSDHTGAGGVTTPYLKYVSEVRWELLGCDR
jgi:hypothetical protein